MTRKKRHRLKKQTRKKQTRKKTLFWTDINKLFKNNKLNIIQKIHDERRDKIYKIFNNIYLELKNRFLFEYNISNFLNLFRINTSSDNVNINIYNMKPFIIYNKKSDQLIECKLGGFGTKINSDIDIDFIFNVINKETENIYNTIKKYIVNANKITAFGTQFDTNFYFSFNKPLIQNVGPNNYKKFIPHFAALYCKITSREEIENINYDIYESINITIDEYKIIKGYYTIAKNITRDNIIKREEAIFNKYTKQFELCFNDESYRDIDNINYLKYHICQPHSYIFNLSVYFALKEDNKIKFILGNYSKIEQNILLYLSTLENLFECYYNNKPKYLLRSLYSLSIISKNNELLLDKNLIKVVNEFLQNQKDKNKKTIPYCITDAIITDLLDFGDCSNKIKCNIIKDIKKTNNLYDIDYCKKSKNANYKNVLKTIIKILFDNIRDITDDYNDMIIELGKLVNIKD